MMTGTIPLASSRSGQPLDAAHLEALIIGAGPAGLTAATYLARFRRRVLVADGGEPRASWIPVSHNMPGFPAGITGAAMLARLREQAEEYGAVVESGRVKDLRPVDGGFRAELNGRHVTAGAVVLATGVVDRYPRLPGVEDAVRRSLVRICPICDGFEATGKSIAILSDDDRGAREAAFLRTYSDRVTLIHVGKPGALSRAADLETMGVVVLETSMDQVRLSAEAVTVRLDVGGVARFDLVYSAFGTTPNADLARHLGVKLDDDIRLLVDTHQQTSLEGLYAIGDVVHGLNQIAVATAEAAVAATAIHNAFRRTEGLTI